MIHGMDAEYNDIVNWHYKDIVNVFGGEGRSKTFQAKTKKKLESLLLDEAFNTAKGLQFVEVYMSKEDAPRSLVKVAEQTAMLNAKQE